MPKKKHRIDLSSSIFANYIEEKLLYVDKSMFIEHFMDNPSKVLLITRPRRMGKSTNMNMLAEFLDCKKKSANILLEQAKRRLHTPLALAFIKKRLWRFAKRVDYECF